MMVSRFLPHRLTVLLAVLAVAGVGVSLTARPVAATSWGWCWDDPVLSLNGQRVAIQTGVQGEPAVVDKQVQAAVTTVYLPQGVRGAVLSYTKTFFKDKQVIWVPTATPWQPGQPLPVTVVVTFKAKADLPAQVVVDYPGGQVQAQGTTLGETRLSFTLPVR